MVVEQCRLGLFGEVARAELVAVVRFFQYSDNNNFSGMVEGGGASVFRCY